MTGQAAIERTVRQEAQLNEAAQLLRTEPEGLVEALERLLERQRAADRELTRLRQSALEAEAAELAAMADGVVVARRDGRSADELRSLAQAVVHRGVRAAVVGGSPDGVKVSIAAVDRGPARRHRPGQAGGRPGGWRGRGLEHGGRGRRA